MARSRPKRTQRAPSYTPRPAATAKDRIAWRICGFAAGAEVGCACLQSGHGHCEAVGRVAETVFTWAKDDLAAQSAPPLNRSETDGGRGAP